MKGYWNDPGLYFFQVFIYCVLSRMLILFWAEATAKTITPDGWLKSGDLAVIDEEGFVYIKDRSKYVINIITAE